MTSTANLSRFAGVLVLAVGLFGFATVMEAAVPSAREALLRYVVAAVVVLAVAPAHVLLPDPLIPWLQRLNPPPGRLLRRGGGRWAWIVMAVIAPVVALGFRTGEMAGLVEATLLLVGVSVYGYQDVMGLGPISQEWQEGRRGGLYRRAIARNPRASFQVPHGMIPAMLASGRVFVVGFAFTLAVIVLHAAAGLAFGWIAPAVLLGWSAMRLATLSRAFDRAYYQTSALYAELLHSPASRLGARPGIGFEAVYWVPRRWRAHAWAGLLQLDRRLPLGRLFVLGALGFLALMVWDVGQTAVFVYVGMALFVRNATILRFARADIAPPAFHLAHQSVTAWVATRFFMNLRWTLPLMITLGLASIFSSWLTWGMVLVWTGVDILLALITALFATYVAEQRYRRRFA